LGSTGSAHVILRPQYASRTMALEGRTAASEDDTCHYLQVTSKSSGQVIKFSNELFVVKGRNNNPAPGASITLGNAIHGNHTPMTNKL
jgi:hypothetical protein